MGVKVFVWSSAIVSPLILDPPSFPAAAELVWFVMKGSQSCILVLCFYHTVKWHASTIHSYGMRGSDATPLHTPRERDPSYHTPGIVLIGICPLPVLIVRKFFSRLQYSPVQNAHSSDIGNNGTVCVYTVL